MTENSADYVDAKFFLSQEMPRAIDVAKEQIQQETNGIGHLAHVSADEMRKYVRENFPDAVSKEMDLAPTGAPDVAPLTNETPKRRIVIGTLSYDAKMWCKHAFSVLQAAFAIAREGWELSFCLREGDSMVARGRNVIVAKFLEDPNNTDLFLIDTDLEFKPEDLVRMCKHPVDVVAGCYPYKDDTGQFPLRWPVDGLFETNGLWEVNGVTPGFLRLTRKCLDRMVRQLPHLAYVDNALGENKICHMFFDNACRPNGVYDEGYIFCEHWRSVGGKVWVDPLCNITHMGMKGYNYGTLPDWLQRTADNVSKLKADFPHIPDLDLVSFCTKREIDREKFDRQYSNAGQAGVAQENAGGNAAQPVAANNAGDGERGRGRPTDGDFVAIAAKGVQAAHLGQGTGGQPGGEVRPGT